MEDEYLFLTEMLGGFALYSFSPSLRRARQVSEIGRWDTESRHYRFYQEKGVWKIDGYSRADRVTLAPFQKSVGSSGYSIQERRVNSLPFNGIDYVWEPVKNYRIQGEEKYSRFMSRRGRGGELGNLFRFTTVKLDRLDDRRFVVFGEAMLGDGERVNVTLPLEVYEATLESVKKRLSEGTGVPGSE